jgi:hypothetical protein
MSNIKKDNPDRLLITEMFMAQASDDRCFYGVIQRSKDNYGNEHVFSRIIINDGLIQACAGDQWELGKNLDQMCIMILDMGLHENAGVFTEIFGDKYFLN